MTKLINTTITKLAVNADSTEMFFKLSSGATYCQTLEGDCCSETWFSDVYNFSALINSLVLSVEKIDLTDYNTEDGRSRQAEDQVYGVKLTTSKGSTTIAFRNSSNGYYGGNLSTFTPHTGPLPEGSKRITDDWSA